MTDEEFDKWIEKVESKFQEWMDKEDSLMETSISEMLGNAFYEGYAQGRKDINDSMKCCGNCNNALTQTCYNCIRDSDSATQDLWGYRE